MFYANKHRSMLTDNGQASGHELSTLGVKYKTGMQVVLIIGLRTHDKIELERHHVLSF